jgi:hypothetical protein
MGNSSQKPFWVLSSPGSRILLSPKIKFLPRRRRWPFYQSLVLVSSLGVYFKKLDRKQLVNGLKWVLYYSSYHQIHISLFILPGFLFSCECMNIEFMLGCIKHRMSSGFILYGAQQSYKPSIKGEMWTKEWRVLVGQTLGKFCCSWFLDWMCILQEWWLGFRHL